MRFSTGYSKRWKDEWTCNPPRSNLLTYDPTQKPCGFSTSRREWCQLNRLRTEHGLCGDYIFKCGWRISPACDCGAPVQNIHHIIYDCPNRKYAGESLDLFSPNVYATQWVKELDLKL